MKKAIGLFVVGALAVGCASTGQQTKKGGAIGAGAGAVVGGLIGHKTGSTARGAIIGAVVGGAAGALIGREMDQKAEKLAQELEGAKVSRVGEGIAVTFDSGILFPFDSAELLPDARVNLQKLADQLRSEPRSEVMIVGHTDSQGTDSYNQELSERRARAAVGYLASQGVDRQRLRPSGRGEEEPIETNASEDGRQQNRRVEVAIYASRQWRDEAQREAGDN
jgi:outer membrane protein OmpA-like peptidoglycan-associated protein